MRTRKLSKSAKGRNDTAGEDWIDSPDLTFKASLDDLKSQSSRQSLRQHFTGAFPETQLRPSLELEDSLATSTMRSKGRLTRKGSNGTASQDSEELSSSSTTSVNSTDMKRLSTVQESNGKMDIAEMITLLHELKKTASPAELVALQKALLPSKDSSAVPSPVLPPAAEDTPPPRSPFVRRRSMLPPGVATRNASGDPLRTPEEALAMLDKPRPRTQPTSKNELAALDLANENMITTKRASTPLDLDITHMGAYQPGTLRVMNGRASPEPSLLLNNVELAQPTSSDAKLPEDFETAPTTPDHNRSLELRQSSSDPETIRETILISDKKAKMPQRIAVERPPRARAPNFAETRRASEPTVPCSLTPQKDEVYPLRTIKTAATLKTSMAGNPLRERAHSSQEGSLGRNDSRIIRTADSSPMKRRDEDSLPQSTTISSRQSLEPGALHVTGDKTPPAIANSLQPNEPSGKAGMPRFAQRWSHRLSQLASESTAESQLPSNPFEDNSALHSLSKRLSTVTDRTLRERQESSARETPEIALAKLTGEIDHPIYKQPGADAGTETTQSPVSSAENLSNTRGRRSSQPQKTDSGYGSDVLPVSKEPKLAREAGNGNVYTITEQTHKAYGGIAIDDDTVSLYSVNQVLKSPYLLSGIAMPSPPDARGSKKHLSLLGLNKDTDADDLDVGTGALLDPAPPPAKPSKQHKKLQKPMPSAVRNSIRSAITKKDERRRSKAVVIPDLHDDLEDTFAETSYFGESKNIAKPDSHTHHSVKVEATTGIPDPADATLRANSTASISTPELRSDQVIYTCREPSGNIGLGVTMPPNSIEEHNDSSKQSGSTIPRASHFELGHMSCFNGAADTSVGQSKKVRGPLTSHPPTPTTTTFKPSTVMLNRTVSVPEVHQVRERTLRDRSSFRRSRNFGAPNTQSEIASDQSRRHSRAMAKQKNEEVLESFGFIPSLPKRRSKIDVKSTTNFKASLKTKQLPPTPAPRSDERPGDSTESIADVIRRASEARAGRPSSNGKESHESEDPRPHRSRKAKIKRSSEIETRVLAGSDTEDLRGSLAKIESATPEVSEPPRMSWEQHAEQWRQQRESIEQKLGASHPVKDEQGDDSPPTIVVSEAVTPPENGAGKDYDTGRPRSNSAEVQAQAYRDLLDTAELNTPTEEYESATDESTIANKTRDPESERPDLEERTDSAYLVKPYQSDAAPIERSRSPGGRVVTPSGHYHPYSPTVDITPDEGSHVNNDSQTTSNSVSKPQLPASVVRRSLPPRKEPLGSLIDRFGGGHVIPPRNPGSRDRVIEV